MQHNTTVAEDSGKSGFPGDSRQSRPLKYFFGRRASARFWFRRFPRPLSLLGAGALALLLSLAAGGVAAAQEAAPDQEEPQGSFIGKNADGDAVMRTAPRPRGEYRSYGDYYRDGVIISPEVRPIIPLPPGPRPPYNPYPGPGSGPGPRPRDGANQLHQYNYNPQYPQEAPRRSGGGFGGGPGGRN